MGLERAREGRPAVWLIEWRSSLGRSSSLQEGHGPHVAAVAAAAVELLLGTGACAGMYESYHRDTQMLHGINARTHMRRQ